MIGAVMQVLPVEVILNGLAVAAGASLFVERFIEFLKSVRERANRQLVTDQARLQTSDNLVAATEQANLLQQSLVPVQSFAVAADNNALSTDAAGSALRLSAALDQLEIPDSAGNHFSVMAVDDNQPDNFEQHSAIRFIPLPRVSNNQARLDLFIRLAPVGFGIILAGYFDLHLIAMFLGIDVPSVSHLLETSDWKGLLRRSLDILGSGILIGGGSQPVHLLVTFITKRKLSTEEQQQLGKTSVAAAGTASVSLLPATTAIAEFSSTSPAWSWRDIPYSGGVNPLSLETVHRRSVKPDLVVVHHTAMHSSLGFEAIREEFLVNKGWLTGYHAVIMPDGSIQPFCRWDRCGNHALGQNNHTLGVAFHGNFHAGTDRYSNADGRFGNSVPTPEQLEAGTRLIALWMHLYQLDPELSVSLSRHGDLSTANTVCPGSRFPWNDLLTMVNECYQHWHQDALIQKQIGLYRQRPFVMP
jgi:hypothetical protein